MFPKLVPGRVDQAPDLLADLGPAFRLHFGVYLAEQGGGVGGIEVAEYRGPELLPDAPHLARTQADGDHRCLVDAQLPGDKLKAFADGRLFPGRGRPLGRGRPFGGGRQEVHMGYHDE